MVKSGNCCLAVSVERWCRLFRFEEIRFQRPQEASNFCTGMIYAILFEVDDRETIGACKEQQILAGLKYLVFHLMSMRKLPLCNHVLCRSQELELTFGTVKRTVSHLIILTVLMGYGVVRPTLGGLTSKVVMLGGTFFLHLKCLSW
uniref:Transmembrane protein 87A n=1 Tax=Tanacetum cinerariifolium TaxID=118510 RepID=A0A6L2LDE8_TANCI|nr:transmembrane protein 87A [Tanacetum cinerariifolium]